MSSPILPDCHRLRPFVRQVIGRKHVRPFSRPEGLCPDGSLHGRMKSSPKLTQPKKETCGKLRGLVILSPAKSSCPDSYPQILDILHHAPTRNLRAIGVFSKTHLVDIGNTDATLGSKKPTTLNRSVELPSLLFYYELIGKLHAFEPSEPALGRVVPVALASDHSLSHCDHLPALQPAVVTPGELRISIDPDQSGDLDDGKITTRSNSSPLTEGPQGRIAEEKTAIGDKEQCPICHSTEGEMETPWTCKHLIHKTCWIDWQADTQSWPTCAICRAADKEAAARQAREAQELAMARWALDNDPFARFHHWFPRRPGARPRLVELGSSSIEEASYVGCIFGRSFDEFIDKWHRPIAGVALGATVFLISLVLVSDLLRSVHSS
ncbi:hypothetical protein PSTG_04307 [Puccinia striiformis f. sp. tritici PST-78]|uniref:RING-type domain-containing protein n=1 Tax=Puccinia striiformis f. sp. tritici PST-78 TaxID=1165861 RepID=A0A0L0VTS6_9BASI|nr:hypothetical protein PSTG_04307 [Puccinia striiformis f. sp. tritici PST-78]